MTKLSHHCHFTQRIVVVLLAFSPMFAWAWDENDTKPAARQLAMKVSSKKLESPKAAMEPLATMIKQVQATDVGHEVQVRVIGSGDLSCLPFRLNNPDRLVLDCSGARVQVQQTPLRVDLDPVRAVRLGQFKTDVARVVIDLRGQAPYVIHADGNSLTVVFESLHQKPSVSNSTSEEKETSPRPVNGESEQAASTNPFPFFDNLPLPRYSELPSEVLIRAENLPTDRLPSPSQVGPRPPAVSSDIPDLQETGAEAGAPSEVRDSAPPDQDYVIGPQDVLAINVWHEPELSQSVPVRPDGKISLPLMGELQVSGLTPRLLQARVTKDLNAYIRKPQVTVIVREVNSHKFYILGEVERPGVYTLTSSMTVLNALAAAGGFRDFAKVKRIYVLRLMPDNSRKRIHYDFKAAVSGKKIGYRDFELQGGDTLVVP